MESLNIGKRRLVSELSNLREEIRFMEICRNIGKPSMENWIVKKDSIAGERDILKNVRHIKKVKCKKEHKLQDMDKEVTWEIRGPLILMGIFVFCCHKKTNISSYLYTAMQEIAQCKTS